MATQHRDHARLAASTVKEGVLLKRPVSSSSGGLKKRFVVLRYLQPGTAQLEWHKKATSAHSTPPLGWLPLHRGSTVGGTKSDGPGVLVVHTEGRVLRLSVVSTVEFLTPELIAWEKAIKAVIHADEPVIMAIREDSQNDLLAAEAADKVSPLRAPAAAAPASYKAAIDCDATETLTVTITRTSLDQSVGVTLQQDELRQQTAVAIGMVTPGGPSAGKLRPKDCIVDVNGAPVRTMSDVAAKMARFQEWKHLHFRNVAP